MKNMIKSYSFWTAFAGSLGLLVVSIAKIFGYEITAAGIEEIVMALCGVLIVLGVVKKPKKSHDLQNNYETINDNSQKDENK